MFNTRIICIYNFFTSNLYWAKAFTFICNKLQHVCPEQEIYTPSVCRLIKHNFVDIKSVDKQVIFEF